MNYNMKNGLYQVTTSYLCAGFVIQDGKMIACAPILKKKIKYWVTVAKWICEDTYDRGGKPHRTTIPSC